MWNQRIIKLLLITLVIWNTTSLLWAQSETMESPARIFLDDLFHDLDKTHIPTGLLKDYAIDKVEWDLYSGNLTDSNFVSFPTMINILETIRSASVLSYPFLPVDELVDAIDNLDLSAVPVYCALYQYDYIKEDAITGGFLRYQSGRVSDMYDVDGNWLNPYNQKYVFAFSPRSNILGSKTVTYSFDGCFFSNCNVDHVDFDAGDGLGYQRLSLSSGVSITYSDYGEKELNLRVVLDNGDAILAHSKVAIVEVVHHSTISSTVEDQVDTIVCHTPYRGIAPRAIRKIRYAWGHSQIEKPFIVVEGVDPMAFAGKESTRCGFTDIDNVVSMLPSIASEYDIIYVNWESSDTYIQANANLLIEIIQEINREKIDSTVRNVIMGQSMGGLVTRYALCKMETEGIPHGVSTFISDDVPHLGANVPIGAQYAVRDLLQNMSVLGYSLPNLMLSLQNIFPNSSLSKYSGIGEYAGAVLNLFDAPSSRQMLINFVNTAGQIDNSMFEDFQTEINAMGFPVGDPGKSMSLLAISNGALEGGATDGRFLSMNAEFATNWLTSMLLTLSPMASPTLMALCASSPAFATWAIFPGRNSINCTLNIDPFISRGCRVYQNRISLHKKFVWLVDVPIVIYDRSSYGPQNAFPIDCAGGSYYRILSNGNNASLEISDSHSDAFYSSSFSLNLIDKFMFIPTVSSLCIGEGRRMLEDADYLRSYTVPETYIGQTPFSSIYIRDTCSEHIDLSGVDAWLRSGLDAEIVAPDVIIQSGYQISVSGFVGAISWSSSDEAVAGISPSGVLDIVPGASGFVTISAVCHNLDADYVLTRRIWVGFPSFSLSLSVSPLKIYTVRAVCMNDEFDQLREISNVSYYWGIEEGPGAEWEWQESANLRLVGDQSSVHRTYVYFRVVIDGVSSDTYMTSVPRYRETNPLNPPVFVGNDGDFFINDPDNGDMVQVKSSLGLQDVSFVIDNIIRLEFDHMPSTVELYKTILENEHVLQALSSLKPRGDLDMMYLAVEMFTPDDVSPSNFLLKFVFDQNL